MGPPSPPPPRWGRRRARHPEDLPDDLQRLLDRVRTSDAATLAHRLAPAIGEIDAAVLAGRLTWSELALALGVPRTSAHYARDRARAIAAELRACGLLPSTQPGARGAAPVPVEPASRPTPQPSQTPPAPPPPVGRFRAAVYEPAPPPHAPPGETEEAEPVGDALRRMIDRGPSQP